MSDVPFNYGEFDEPTTIDEVREYWDRQPCNVRYSPQPVGSLVWSQEVTRRKYAVGSHIVPFADFSRWSGKRVLEIGCGIGSDTLRFIKAGAIVSAVDLSPRSIEIMRQRCDAERCRGSLSSWICNAEEWLPVGPFDLVYSFGVIHHTPNPERVVRNAFERLKPGGELRIMLYAKWSIKNLTLQQPEAQAGCPIVRTYTERSVRELLKDFEDVRVEIGRAHV